MLAGGGVSNQAQTKHTHTQAPHAAHSSQAHLQAAGCMTINHTNDHFQQSALHPPPPAARL